MIVAGGDIARIKQRFGITCGTTINGETCEVVSIKDEDWNVLLETQRRGYIQIREEYEKRVEDKKG